MDSYRGDGLNLYAYVANNPINYIDPTGHCKEKGSRTAGRQDINRIFTGSMQYESGGGSTNDIDIKDTLIEVFGYMKTEADLFKDYLMLYGEFDDVNLTFQEYKNYTSWANENPEQYANTLIKNMKTAKEYMEYQIETNAEHWVEFAVAKALVEQEQHIKEGQAKAAFMGVAASLAGYMHSAMVTPNVTNIIDDVADDIVIDYADDAVTQGTSKASQIAESSPIKIPTDAKIIEQTKTGYQQIKYKWSDGTYKYEARWHTRTPGAPEGQGNTWVVNRTTPGTSTGQPKLQHILTGENQWTPMSEWQSAVRARQSGIATPQQQLLLDHGHWSAP